MPQNTLAFREVRIEIPPEPPKNRHTRTGARFEILCLYRRFVTNHCHYRAKEQKCQRSSEKSSAGTSVRRR